MAAKITRTNPATVRAPTGYTHGVTIEGAERRVIISGQVGITPDGTIPETGEAQIAQALANLKAVLRTARAAMFSGEVPASTLLFVAGLADPRFVVEVEAEAVA